MTSPASPPETPHQPCVILVGAGVVGSAIAQAHIDASVSFSLVDLDPGTLSEAVAKLELVPGKWQVSPITNLAASLPAIHIVCGDESTAVRTPIVIESIAERLDAKRDFFSKAEQIFSDDTILCSNTSTLRIGTIAEELGRPENFCGMHFFMPVSQRDAVELVCGETTSDSTIQLCSEHVRRIRKEPLPVGDGPGFIVNRLLSPYLNEAMLMLGRGVMAERIERAALAYGMPMSPLELMDWIGTRTVFDAGRVYWQSFPTRFDPAPMLGSMVKKKRLGRSVGAGFYDYEMDQRSTSLSDFATKLSEDYQRDVTTISDEDVAHLLSIPMWIEAAIAFREGVATSHQQFDLAMRGGLGYRSDGTWLEYFDSLGSAKIIEIIDRYRPIAKSLHAPDELVAMLKHCGPTTAMDQFASKR